MASKGLPRTHLCCAPGLSPICSRCSSLLEQPQSCGGCLWAQQLPKEGCAIPTHFPSHSDLPGCSLAGPRHLLPLWQSFPFSAALTNLFVLVLLKPILLCNFLKLLGNLLSFSHFLFLISIYTLNSSTSFFTHGMSLFLMLDYFLHSLIQSDLFRSECIYR